MVDAKKNAGFFVDGIRGQAQQLLTRVEIDKTLNSTVRSIFLR